MLELAIPAVRRAHALWLAIKALRCSMQDVMRLPLCFIATAVDSPEDDICVSARVRVNVYVMEYPGNELKPDGLTANCPQQQQQHRTMNRYVLINKLSAYRR